MCEPSCIKHNISECVKCEAEAAILQHGCIYKLTNLINGDSYIGKDKSGDPENHRWKRHLDLAFKGSGHYIHNAIADYGAENFSAEVIWRGPVSQVYEKEIVDMK